MGWWWLPIAAAILVALDRLALAAEARGWLYWRRSKGGSGAGSGAIGELIEVFQPSRAHTVEEIDNKRREVVRPGEGGPPLGVDLDAGVAWVTRGATPPAERDAAAGIGG